MRWVAVALAVALLIPAAPAQAHAGDAPDATAYRTAVTGVTPPQPGLTVRAVEAGARLELSNGTGHTVEVLGYSGEPYLAVRPDGTWENANSPAAYLNETLAGETPVPAAADPTAPPSWRRVSPSTTVRWHDRRARWLSPGLPPAATADPGREHRLRDWSVPLRAETITFEVRGTLDWVPPPVTWLWWTLTALIAALAFAARRWIAPIGPSAALLYLLYAVLRALDAREFAPLPVAVALIAMAPALWRGPFVLALGGAVLAAFGGGPDTGVFTAAVVPMTGPAVLGRIAVAAALGAGLAMAAAGVLRLRAASGAGAAEDADRVGA